MKITNKKAAKVVANRKAPHVGRLTRTTGGLSPSPTASMPRRTREVMTPLILTIWVALLGRNGRNDEEKRYLVKGVLMDEVVMSQTARWDDDE
jgi:hypothetical protein